MEQSYKEKYEQAIEKIKNLIDKDHNDINVDDILNVFPELKESEDEKVSKRISQSLHGYLLNSDEIIQADAWLKKQAEHANFLSKIQVGDKVTRNEDGVLVNLSQLKRVAKPADKVEPKFKVGDKIYLKPEYRMPDDDTPIANTVKEIRRIDDKHYRFDGSYIFIEDQDKYELVEQKPAWSEEDEQHVNSLLKRLDGLCRIKLERTRFAISEDRDWLKSLRPQNRWKPSKEQIDLLQAIINEPNNAASESCQIVLREVLEQLKKLKEGKV